jgi:hypothetical protein
MPTIVHLKFLQMISKGFLRCCGDSGDEKFFDVGKKSARLIVPKLKEGHRMLRMERVGSGKETLYIPTEVTSNSSAKAR